MYQSIFLNSRREAIVIFLIWFVALLWTVPYCYLNGYSDSQFKPEDLTLILGVPSWIFYGLVCPWLVANVLATWISFFFIKDDELEPAAGTADSKGEI